MGAAPERLNPFAFPSDTTFRFVLLVVAVLGASFYIWNGVYFTFADNIRDVRTYERCLEESRLGVDAVAQTAAGDLDAGARASAAFQDCIAPVERAKAAWILGGTALVMALTVLLYLVFPAWKVRRAGLRPLTADDAPEVVEYLNALAREAGLRRTPTFVWNPLRRTGGGLAFGRLGRYYVAIDGGLVMMFYTDKAAFRAVVLHELAHLRNRDVDETYFTIATWYAFLVGAVLPYALTLVDEPASYIFSLSWRLLALVALVYLIRNAVLRAREVYADARAFGWDGFGGALRRVVAALPAADGRPWRSLLGVHPNPHDRVRSLDDPRPLFAIGFSEAFATGVTATIAYTNVVTLLDFYLKDALAIRWLAGLLFAPLAVGVVGLGAWRATFAALARGERPPSGVGLGLGLALGFLLGQELSFFAAIPGAPGAAAGLFRFDLAWALLLVAAQILLVRWIVATATAWHEGTPPTGSTRPVYALGLAIASGTLAVGLGWLLYLRDLQEIFAIVAEVLAFEHDAVSAAVWAGPELAWTAVRHGVLLLVVQDGLTLPVLALMWALPLGVWLWRSRNRAPDERRGGFEVRFALAVGIAGGVAFWLAHLTVRLVTRAAVAQETRDLAEYRLSFFVWAIVLALAVQVVVAAGVAARSPRHPGIHALFAAFVTGLLAASGILVLNVAFGGTVDSPFAWMVFRQVLNEGALLALPAAGAGALGGYAVRRVRTGRLRAASAAP